MSDYVHVMYGEEGGYGVVSKLRGVRVGINAYINGFLKEENIRIRKQPIEFEIRPPSDLIDSDTITTYTDFHKKYDNFELKVDAGEVNQSQVITAFGPNGIGKTTYAKILAGVVKPDDTFNCGGGRTVGGRYIKCWRSPRSHGSETFVQGVQNSCNPVFMDVAERLGSSQF